MTPGNDKRGLDFTDLMMWLAIASKHVRLMVLLVCFSLLCGLDYFIYARPLYFSKALVSFKEIPGTIDTQSLNRSERPRMTILSELQAPTLQSRVEAKLGNVPNRFGVKKELIRRVQADFVSEDSIELGISTYSPQWASTFPETLVQ